MVGNLYKERQTHRETGSNTGSSMCAFLCGYDDELACRRRDYSSPAGGASMGLILGPFAGGIGITVILVLQALLFGDGGLTSLGANILNMAIIGVIVPCAVFLLLYKLVGVKGNKLYAVIFVSAFAGDVLAAIAAGTELGLSQPVFQYGINVAVPAMALNHSIIGVGEGIITAILVGTLLKLRPDLLMQSPILKRIPQLQNKDDVEEENKQAPEQKKQAKE